LVVVSVGAPSTIANNFFFSIKLKSALGAQMYATLFCSINTSGCQLQLPQSQSQSLLQSTATTKGKQSNIEHRRRQTAPANKIYTTVIIHYPCQMLGLGRLQF